MRWHAERLKMSQVAGKDGESVALGGGGDHDIGEAGSVALTAGEIGQDACKPGGGEIKRQDTGSIEVQYRFEPRAQVPGFAGGSLSFGLGDAVLDFRNGDNREE